jgi:hypothetical protein
MVNPSFYFDLLYPFQDRVIQVIRCIYRAGLPQPGLPADLGRVLCSVRPVDCEMIRWSNAPSKDVFISQLNELGEGLLLPRG